MLDVTHQCVGCHAGQSDQKKFIKNLEHGMSFR